MDNIEFVGEWWIPNEPDHCLHGTLKASFGSAVELDLIGSFKHGVRMIGPERYEIIHGRSVDGKKLTLVDSAEIKSKTTLPGTKCAIYHVVFAIVGEHYNTISEINFSTIECSFTNLDNWLGINNFIIDLNHPRMTVQYEHRPPLELQINEKLTFSIMFELKGPTMSHVQREIGLVENKYWRLKLSDAISIPQWLTYLQLVSEFLCLATTVPVYPLKLSAVIPGEANSSIPRYLPIFYYLQIKEDLKEVDPWRMLFTFGDVYEKFSEILDKWISRAEIIGSTYSLYFSTLYNPRINLENRFLNLTQALESYHRSICDGKYTSEEEYKIIAEGIIDNLPSTLDGDFRQSLVSRIKYGNELSLRRRIKELYDRHKEVLQTIIEKRDEFIEDVINTRNYLTHHDTSLAHFALKDIKLFRISNRLQLIIEICLLSEIGIPSESIAKIFSKDGLSRRSLYL